MEPERGRIVTVAVCRRPGLAQLAKSILDSAGIESFIQGEHANALYTGAVSSRVVVSEKDADEAAALLSAEGLEVESTPIEAEGAGFGNGFIYVLLVLAAIGAVVITRSLG